MGIKCSVFIATSVDGYIAGPKGDISWLENPDYASTKPPGLSYDDFISTVDGIVMGRNTFEKVLTFGSWPYEKTPVFVLTSRKLKIPDHLNGKVYIESGPPTEVAERLARKSKKHLYIDGGVTIQRFLNSGLIDELTITIIPVLLGEGIPLFSKSIPNQLRLMDTKSASNGFVQIRYRVNNQSK